MSLNAVVQYWSSVWIQVHNKVISRHNNSPDLTVVIEKLHKNNSIVVYKCILIRAIRY